ncbi:MAG: hypothetical protein OEZ05_01290 [Nitrospirota bacterium]|nr:hypothetical protein [Nitrospirota bacterium]MDH5585244.1 hypothetical protein [Nitrospirota bacterium]
MRDEQVPGRAGSDTHYKIWENADTFHVYGHRSEGYNRQGAESVPGLDSCEWEISMA